MTKEEIINEAHERVNRCTPLYPECFIQGYIASAEPREKRIEELERENRLLGERCNQLLKDKGELTDKIADIKANCEFAIEGRDVKIKELEKENERLTVSYETLKLHDEEEIGMLKSRVAELENKIADIKANCDYVLEGKENEYREERKKLCDDFENMKAGLESQIAELGERCNQLLKDKGDLTDELQACKEKLAETIENDEVGYETLKLHDQEEIGMLKSENAELKEIIKGLITPLTEDELRLTITRKQVAYMKAKEILKEIEK